MHVMMHVPCRANDVQVEFTMLDPHVRATLKPDNKVRMWDMRMDCKRLFLQCCCCTLQPAPSGIRLSLLIQCIRIRAV